jgi:hypothetical protein
MRDLKLFAAVALMGACSTLGAQTITGSVRGIVTDPSGAIVPNAKVAATNVATGVQTTATTNNAGEYSIRFLQIGQYRIEVTAANFNKATYGPFSLEIDQTAKIDVPLAVGNDTQSVSVTEQLQPILQTDSATNGETFTENTINSVPLNGRDFSQLTVFTPGAVSTDYGQFGGQNSSERSTNTNDVPSVNGNRQQSNNYLLDGQEINENLNNTIGYTPSPDSLDQIRVISANANAEFGNVNGGDVVMVMKSGTNQFHGSVFGFLESAKLDANSWTNDNQPAVLNPTTGDLVPDPIPKNPFTQTIFGGTVGGPIYKDRLFFFADYEGYRWHQGGSQTYSVAPAAFRTGDLSSVLNAPLVIDPGTHKKHGIQLYNTQNPGGAVPYVNNQVPITNPVAQFLFAHPEIYPLPNHAPNVNDPLGIQNNFVGPTASFQRNDQGDVKIDWHLHTSDIISGRYSQGIGQNGTTQNPIAVEFPSASNYPDHLFTVDWTHTLSPAIVNLARASYARIRYNSGVTTDPSGVFGLTGNATVGIPSMAQQTAGFSQQNYTTTGAATQGTSGGSAIGAISSVGANPQPEIFIDNVFQYADDLTWQRGKHLFKFGAQFTRYQQNSFYPGNDGELGSFNYTGQFTADPSGSPLQFGYADFLADEVYEASVGQVTGRTGQRQWRDAGYAQDDWKITPKLTLNLGIRYEFEEPIYEVNNKEANLNLTTGQILYAGTPAAAAYFGSGRALYDPTYTNVQPRIGFAFQPTERFVVRGGYGITNYLEGTGANLRLTQNPPFHSDFDDIATVPSLTNGVYSPGRPLSAAIGFPTVTPPTTTFYAWQKNLQPAQVQEFSLFTEYQVARNSSLSVGYVGELGHHLTDPQYQNQLTAPGTTAPYASVVGQNGVVKLTASNSSSNYNALEAVFRQRLTAGLELTANYTYSKSLTDDIGYYGVSNIDGTYYQQNVYDLKSEWGPAGADVRHAFNATGTYTLPYGRGQRFGSSAPYYLQSVAGGWRLSVSDVSYTGFPITLTSPANYSNLVFAYSGAARPDQIANYTHSGRSIQNWFGTGAKAAYIPQPDDSFGTVRPGSERAPGFENIDAALLKSFDTFKEQRLDFRADFFNLLNIASYGNPDNGISDTNFGQITTTRSTERHIQLELKYAF